MKLIQGLAIVSVIVLASSAEARDIIHDAEHQILVDQHGDEWRDLRLYKDDLSSLLAVLSSPAGSPGCVCEP